MMQVACVFDASLASWTTTTTATTGTPLSPANHKLEEDIDIAHEDDTYLASLQADVQDGLLRGVHWDGASLAWAHHVLPELSLPYAMALVDCTFADDKAWETLISLLLMHAKELTSLSIATADLSRCLPILAKVLCHNSNDNVAKITTLELVERSSSSRLTEDGGVCLQTLVRDMQSLQSLSLQLSLQQKDYTVCLQALQQGWEQRRRLNNSNHSNPLAIALRGVSFPNHEHHLHRFVAALCKAPCIHTLELSTRRSRHADLRESMRVGPGFLPALARLLALGTLQSLHVPHIAWDRIRQGAVDPQIIVDLRHALCQNTTLQQLTLSHTVGVDALWTHAIFPALATHNRTVQQLTLACPKHVVPTFLQLLPKMMGLQNLVVTMPWQARQGALWVAALQQSTSVCQVRFGAPLMNDDDKEPQPDENFALVQQLLQRNVWLQQAYAMVRRQEPKSECLMDTLADMATTATTLDAGLDARFVLLRESPSLLASWQS